MAEQVAFWVIAVILVGSSLTVVLLRDLFRAGLLLILCFFVVAALYVTLLADFLAVVQVLIYAGAIGVLLMFAVMLTRDLQHGNPFNRLNKGALLLSLLLLAMVVGVVIGTDWPTYTDVPDIVEMPLQDPETGEAVKGSTSYIAQALFDPDNGWVLAFEIASVLLLAALVGAIVLVRRRENDRQ
jgi:NADH-quinone oxidoreductase subunit J